MTHIYQNWNLPDQGIEELLINFLRGMDKFLAGVDAMGTGRPSTGRSGIEYLQK